MAVLLVCISPLVTKSQPLHDVKFPFLSFPKEKVIMKGYHHTWGDTFYFHPKKIPKRVRVNVRRTACYLPKIIGFRSNRPGWNFRPVDAPIKIEPQAWRVYY